MTNSIFSPLSNPQVHRQVLALAIPMVLSNITVPLLGLVDAAVIGHLEHAWYLGGAVLWRRRPKTARIGVHAGLNHGFAVCFCVPHSP